jgi:hypothetical protein
MKALARIVVVDNVYENLSESLCAAAISEKKISVNGVFDL